MDLDQIRSKPVTDLNADDIRVLNENQDKLTNEEFLAFQDVLSAGDPFPTDPNAVLDNAIDDGLGAQDPQPPVTPEVPANTQPATPAQPTTPTVPAPTVPQTQEQLDAYLEQKRQAWAAEGKTKAEQEAETDKIQQFFDAGYTPKDWNEYTNEMFEKIAPLMEKRIIATLESRNKEFQDQQDKIKATQAEVRKRFEDEFDTLSNNGLIPKRDDPQYEAVKKQIWDVGDNNGKTNITDAYKLWSIIPVTHGGGLVVEGTEAPVDPNAQINRQKQAASRIQPGRGSIAPSKPSAPSWSNIHSTSMDDLIERGKARLGIV